MSKSWTDDPCIRWRVRIRHLHAGDVKEWAETVDGSRTTIIARRPIGELKITITIKQALGEETVAFPWVKTQIDKAIDSAVAYVLARVLKERAA